MHNSDHSDKESCWGGLDGFQVFMSLAVVKFYYPRGFRFDNISGSVGAPVTVVRQMLQLDFDAGRS